MAASFSRRHYETFAALLGVIGGDIVQAKLTEADETWRVFRDALIEIFGEDNPRFDPFRFKQAIEAAMQLTVPQDDDDA